MIDPKVMEYFTVKGFTWRVSQEFVRRCDDGTHQAVTSVLYQGNSAWQACGFYNKLAYNDSDPDWIGPVFPDPTIAYVNAELSQWRAP